MKNGEVVDSEIIHLFTKHINNQCSRDEIAEVHSKLQNGGYAAEWDAAITADTERQFAGNAQSEIADHEFDVLYDKITSKLSASQQEVSPVVQPRDINTWLKIASAAIVVLAVGLIWYYSQQYQLQSQQVITRANDKIIPGSNKAYLTLANGQRISLTDAANGTIASQSGISVTKSADGQLVYTIADTKDGHPGAVQLNTITTPNGGQWQVKLPDGTHVWLNAASSLTYPASFGANKYRRVQLSGEAYFEVAKDRAHPFVVKTAQQELEVLGTHFNLSSYTDDDAVKTSLLEGSVRVTPLMAGAAGKKHSNILKPGQQSVVAEGVIKLQTVDMEQVMAWKNGYFYFENENIKSVMKKIARWYDVEISYQNDVTGEGFTGMISRSKKISQVLQVLEKTKDVHFKIEERRIIVMK